MFNTELPVMTAWKPERVLPNDPIRMSRNPYFWQVDDQGNQLPYIDAVEHSLFENSEVFKLWLAQGKRWSRVGRSTTRHAPMRYWMAWA